MFGKIKAHGYITYYVSIIAQDKTLPKNVILYSSLHFKHTKSEQHVDF